MREYFFILLSTIIGSLGALLIKKVSLKEFWKFRWINFNFIFGLFLYGLSSIFYLLALRLGNVSFIYPLLSLSYIWILIWAKLFLKENISKTKIYGIFLIVLGVVIINI